MRKIQLSKVIIYIILFILTLTVLIPILNLLALSLSDPLQAHKLKGLDIFPKGFSLINYQLLLSNPLVSKSIWNSVFVTALGTALNLVLTSMAAYVLARTQFIGKQLIVIFLIIIMVFEPGLIPEYLLIKDLGLLNNYTSLILYKAVNVFYLFILMRFFNELPEDLIEAARIDGAGHFKIYYRIVVPLNVPAMTTIGLFYGVYRWNEYFRAMIYMSSPTKWPLQVVLRQFVISDDHTAILGVQKMLTYDEVASLNFGSLQAGTIIIAMVPLLILYPFILKYYTKGALDGGVKD